MAIFGRNKNIQYTPVQYQPAPQPWQGKVSVRGELASALSDCDVLYSHLGRLYYDRHKTEIQTDPEYADLMKRIGECEAKVVELSTQLRRYETSPKTSFCPHCGAAAAPDYTFCPRCGLMIPVTGVTEDDEITLTDIEPVSVQAPAPAAQPTDPIQQTQNQYAPTYSERKFTNTSEHTPVPLYTVNGNVKPDDGKPEPETKPADEPKPVTEEEKKPEEIPAEPEPTAKAEEEESAQPESTEPEICPWCDAKLTPGAVFCAVCGCRIKKS